MEPASNKRQASAGPLFDMVSEIIRIISSAVLAALVFLVCLEAFLRGVFNHSLGFVEEVVGYGVVFLTFFGAALALRGASMFQVHFLMDKWSEQTRHWLIRIFVIIALAICIILAWKAMDLMASSFSRGKFAPTVLRTPLWIPQIIPLLGFGVLGIFLVEQFLLTLRKSGGTD